MPVTILPVKLGIFGTVIEGFVVLGQLRHRIHDLSILGVNFTLDLPIRGNKRVRPNTQNIRHMYSKAPLLIVRSGALTSSRRAKFLEKCQYLRGINHL